MPFTQAGQLNIFSRALYLLGILFLILAICFFISAGYAGQILSRINAFLEKKLQDRQKSKAAARTATLPKPSASRLTEPDVAAGGEAATAVLYGSATRELRSENQESAEIREEDSSRPSGTEEDEDTEESTPTGSLVREENKETTEKKFKVTKKVLMKHFEEERHG